LPAFAHVSHIAPIAVWEAKTRPAQRIWQRTGVSSPANRA
jgi:hypothetical protein